MTAWDGALTLLPWMFGVAWGRRSVPLLAAPAFALLVAVLMLFVRFARRSSPSDAE